MQNVYYEAMVRRPNRGVQAQGFGGWSKPSSGVSAERLASDVMCHAAMRDEIQEHEQ